MRVEIKKVSETAIIPTKGSKFAAGFDLYADRDAVIRPNETEMIGTGIAVAITEGYFGGIYARSGLASKQGLRPANCVGIADADFRGEIKVALHNDSREVREVHRGDRIAQLIIQPYPEIEFVETEELPETDRGEGGFGSTGGWSIPEFTKEDRDAEIASLPETYTFTFNVHGYWTTSVDAKSYREAEEIAEQRFSEANFEELEDVDGRAMKWETDSTGEHYLI